jgi:hypothetical protein
MYNTYQHLIEMGYDVYTIGANELNIAFELGQSNHIFSAPSSPNPTSESMRLLYKNLKKIVDDIVGLNPGIVHFTSKHIWNYVVINILAKKCKAKIIHTFHDPIGHEGERRRLGVILYN